MFVRTLYKNGLRAFPLPMQCPSSHLHLLPQFMVNQLHLPSTISRRHVEHLLLSSYDAPFKIPFQMRCASNIPNQDKDKKDGTVVPPAPSTSTSSPKADVTPVVSQKNQLQSTQQPKQQTPQEQRPERSELMKEVTEELDVNAKTLGWIITGSAICLISMLYGKVYMLFGAVPLFLYHSKDIEVMSKTFNRDVMFLWRYSKCWYLSKRIRNENLTLPKVFHQVAKRHPDRMMLQMHDQNWKYKDVASYANRTSRLMQKYGFQKGDVVAMLTLNSPEMVAIVIGLANIGIITSLINTDLRNEVLTQAIKNSGCKGIIFDDELMHAFGDVYRNFDDIKIFQMRHKAKRPEFRVLEEELLKEYNDQPEMFVNIHHDDSLLYMYAPEDRDFKEPIVITHEKFLFDSNATAMMLDLKPTDKIYNPTPLHETTGMILGIGPSVTNCVPTVLRSKFSATDYFKECYIYNCTVGQYAGNMCKQLLLSPVNPIETFHPVKVMYGSGLESDYWQEFVNRFGTKMYEVYNPSKETPNLINMEGKIGVVGFRPKLAPSFMFPHYVIKVFGKEKIPVRDAQGLCQLCDYGEPGMLVRVWNGKDPLSAKVRKIENIFKHGDLAVTNGQILTIDEKLYLRPLKKQMDKEWMNQLVTSEEVEYIASKLTSKRCAAYTISLGYKHDIEVLAIEDTNRTLDLKKFTEELVDHLPKNWVPHYVRTVSKFETLQGNRIDKQALIDQGFNSEHANIFYLDRSTMNYKQMPFPRVVVRKKEAVGDGDHVDGVVLPKQVRRVKHVKVELNAPPKQPPPLITPITMMQLEKQKQKSTSSILEMNKRIAQRLKAPERPQVVTEKKPPPNFYMNAPDPITKVYTFKEGKLRSATTGRTSGSNKKIPTKATVGTSPTPIAKDHAATQATSKNPSKAKGAEQKRDLKPDSNLHQLIIDTLANAPNVETSSTASKMNKTDTFSVTARTDKSKSVKDFDVSKDSKSEMSTKDAVDELLQSASLKQNPKQAKVTLTPTSEKTPSKITEEALEKISVTLPKADIEADRTSEKDAKKDNSGKKDGKKIETQSARIGSDFVGQPVTESKPINDSKQSEKSQDDNAKKP